MSFSCGKCDCCSDDFSKCDVEGAAADDNPATCTQIVTQNPMACGVSNIAEIVQVLAT
eukprot:UN16699